MLGLCAFPVSVRPQVLESPRQQGGNGELQAWPSGKTAHRDLKTPSEYSWCEASVEDDLSMAENLECLIHPLFVISRLYQELFSLPETIS